MKRVIREYLLLERFGKRKIQKSKMNRKLGVFIRQFLIRIYASELLIVHPNIYFKIVDTPVTNEIGHKTL